MNENWPGHIAARLIPITLLLLTLLCWYYLFFGMSMNMTPAAKWQPVDILMLFIMWSIMMAAMMLPAAAPVILLIDKLNRQRLKRNSPYTQTLYFTFGYLLVWAFYSLLITLAQWWLHYMTLLSPMMVSNNLLFSALLLVIAGLYQWTELKQSCLRLCRSPMSLLSSHWQEGIQGAIKLGLIHGQYCLGCCWCLMALLFVTGVMNLKWIAILTLVVVIEKLLPKGELVSKLLGILLILFGVKLLIM